MGILLFLMQAGFCQCKCYYDSALKRKIFTKADEMPEYPGGPDAWRRFLERNLNVPESYIEDGMQLPIKYTFVVEKDGTLANLSMNGRQMKEYNGLDSSFHTMLLLAPKWTPAKCRGKTVVAKMENSIVCLLFQ